VWLILAPVFKELTEEETTHNYFIQYNSVTHTTNFLITVLGKLVSE
jgi:hypothetical protein